MANDPFAFIATAVAGLLALITGWSQADAVAVAEISCRWLSNLGGCVRYLCEC
jgi:hypothetical protein